MMSRRGCAKDALRLASVGFGAVMVVLPFWGIAGRTSGCRQASNEALVETSGARRTGGHLMGTVDMEGPVPDLYRDVNAVVERRGTEPSSDAETDSIPSWELPSSAFTRYTRLS